MTFSQSPLYVILDTAYSRPNDWPRLTTSLLEERVRIFQIRAKDATPEQIIPWGRALAPIIRDAQGTLIINDYPHLVPLTGAHGCHIGQDGGPLADARAAAGPGTIIGRSTHSLQQALAAQEEGADYIGFGPIFATPTKPGRPAIGPEAITPMAQQIRIPAFCIGGITLQNLPDLIRRGTRRAVIVSALLTAHDPSSVARQALHLLQNIPAEH